MSDNVLRQLAELARLDVPALKERWRVLFGTEPPGYNRTFLRKRLAYRIQELAHGGLSQTTRARLDQILVEEGCDELGRTAAPPEASRCAERIAAGTTLIRHWDGERHVVTVLHDGFEYAGRRYKSLSAIARKITGTQWSGPLFFGLRHPGEKAARPRGGRHATQTL
jgi:hypothetical protein